MQIAYIGNFNPEYSTENDVRKAFEHLGHEVIRLQENEIKPENIFSVLPSIDLLLITGTWGDAIPLGDWLDVIHECSMRGIPTATLHLDTFWGTSRGGRKWWREPMFHTAYIFTADGDYQDKWSLMGKNHIWLPPAVRHDAIHVGKSRSQFECDVAFVGSNGRGYHEDVWTYRTELLNKLREICQKNGWSFKNPGGDESKIDRDDDMNDFYASAKVTVGDSLCLKKQDSKYWSDRVPEATGRAGFLIMPQIDELEEVYEGYLPMYQWNDWKDLEKTIKYYLDNESTRQQMQLMAHGITALHHSYVNRAMTILKTVGL